MKFNNNNNHFSQRNFSKERKKENEYDSLIETTSNILSDLEIKLDLQTKIHKETQEKLNKSQIEIEVHSFFFHYNLH